MLVYFYQTREGTILLDQNHCDLATLKDSAEDHTKTWTYRANIDNQVLTMSVAKKAVALKISSLFIWSEGK